MISFKRESVSSQGRKLSPRFGAPGAGSSAWQSSALSAELGNEWTHWPRNAWTVLLTRPAEPGGSLKLGTLKECTGHFLKRVGPLAPGMKLL